MARNYLLALPEELVAAIAAVIEVGDLLSFALTCKECYRITRDRLSSNATYHEQYTIQHDRLPLTIPKLLKLALESDDEAWHLRALEHWGGRPDWSEWKTYHWSGIGDDEAWLEPIEDHSHLDRTFFHDHEVEAFERMMRDQLHFVDSEVDHWLELIRAGNDEPLKGMLIALSPHLNRVNIIAYPYEGDAAHPLSFLCLTITRLANMPGALWPPGFQSLRKVSVCTTTTLQHPHDAFYADASDVAPLFRLPNIKVLNLSLLGYLNEDKPGWEPEPRSSSIEELGFYCCELDEERICKLIRACKVLRRLVLDNGPLKEVTELLATEYGHCLEEPFLHLNTAGMTYPRLVGSFKRLRLLQSPTVEDLLLDQSIEHEHRVSKGDRLQRLQDFLPTSIETIHIVGSGRLREVEMQDALIHAVADLVIDENYSALKEVCLFDAVEGIPKDKGGMFARNAESVRRIVAKGVRLHYPTNGEKVMGRQEHKKLHFDYQSSGNLTEIETDPTPLEERYDD
ncbi:hypothetical protein LTR97_010707 [Elasticomyces elasticus]|uniref:F-box domain-containing protein n=1 Tax=Elasticomyces elasticus TaxID=574655 RepID=A0AAN7VZ37_9PEZI|nr:hypothetical protein LTR97_010707 [Elasticomyces elasticus]